MDRLPANSSNEGFPNENLFGNSHNYNSYDDLSLFPNGTDPTFNDASWGVNANQSRGPPVSGWQQGANHHAATSSHAAFTGQATPYGRNLNQSPVSFPQNQFGNYGAPPPYQYQQPRYDPGLVTPNGAGQNFNLGSHGFNSPVPNGATVTPQALQREGQPSGLQYAIPQNYAPATQNRAIPNPLQYRPVDQKTLLASIPKGADSGMFSIISLDSLARATNSERMNNFVNVGKEAIEWNCTRSAIPSYGARHSRNDLRKLVGNNTTALAKIGKKSSKHKSYPTLSSDIKTVSRTPGVSSVKQEPDSSSSEDSSSDDDSEYSESEDEDAPLPAKRPDNARAGVEYDTIKALWYSKRRQLTTDTIKKRLIEFWELMKTIRDRWKNDQEAVANAEENKQTGDLTFLQSRVKDQRDMAEAAFRAALKHGHRGIIEVLAENTALIFLCYQFLLDRFKADDVNGSLSRAILDLMSNFTTLTTERSEKVHLVKIFPRYAKRGDARTKHWVGKILANIDAADKEAAARAERRVSEQPAAKADQTKPSSPPVKKATPRSVAGVKRAATTSADGAVQKKVATGAVKPSSAPTAASKTNGVVKKPAVTAQSLRGDATKAAASTANNTATRKTVVAKPSGFFSSLQSAQKKPGTSNADKASAATGKQATAKPAEPVKSGFSFAETMARISQPKEEKPVPKKETKVVPNETPEERAKRIRKEQRRKLRVEFKKGEDLVQIKYFTHDPEEEINHGEGQMRDISDAGGEGRALKQSQLMDIDDEDDAEEVQDLRAHEPITLVDFSNIDKEERERNYAPYGGGLVEPTSAERAVREHYENNNLIVFYTSRDEIPPNPREPVDPYNGDQGGPAKQFGRPEEQYWARAQARQARRQGQHNYSQPMAPPYGWPQQAQQFQAPPPPPPPAGGVPDIASILAQLAPAGQQHQASYAPPMPATTQGWMGAPAAAAPPPPAGVPDLSAILASLNAGNTQVGQNSAAAAPTMNYGGQGQQQQQSGKNHPNYKTRVCKYWQEGTCNKGDNCSYRHE
ncbi:uncharacterized protein CLAFUR5_04626 [Fulvia fulva]|uniref:C3H1-type domain-containing protein n=1 Tax=Passalora fulva TaxID=5499 RepID=A0A9Q8P7U4_PASFU|nr:uncharacterized protein CLAFUR5_04626 [Fulvia fulva]KAK4627964.1 hypothetical protein CLAFUR0_04655 [Fulvia fulva]UJO16484.1 hypothetical protein CLAFUR5_04626 [Fulvia fulva]WPV29304.1 hypothetical protein CLAFUW7_04659 [Fulvia fulva]